MRTYDVTIIENNQTSWQTIVRVIVENNEHPRHKAIEWICNNGLEEYIETEDFHGGVEAIINPNDSADRIREAILNKENT